MEIPPLPTWLQGYGLPYSLHSYRTTEPRGHGKPYPYNQAVPRDPRQESDITSAFSFDIPIHGMVSSQPELTVGS